MSGWARRLADFFGLSAEAPREGVRVAHLSEAQILAMHDAFEAASTKGPTRLVDEYAITASLVDLAAVARAYAEAAYHPACVEAATQGAVDGFALYFIECKASP